MQRFDTSLVNSPLLQQECKRPSFVLCVFPVSLYSIRISLEPDTSETQYDLRITLSKFCLANCAVLCATRTIPDTSRETAKRMPSLLFLYTPISSDPPSRLDVGSFELREVSFLWILKTLACSTLGPSDSSCRSCRVAADKGRRDKKR